ncbi:MAG: metal ABC transporter ATP-binding protein [Thermodesulfobacteriota bacterium]
MNQIIVDLENVTSGYGDKVIFENLSIKIEKGQFTGIVGPTGSGKTTLLKIILGVIEPIGGRIHLLDRGVNDLPAGTVGYVPQLETVDWDFPVTVEQVIMMGLYKRMRIIPWPRRKEKKLVYELMERLGIKECAHHSIRDLSGGQQQRTFLARALIGNPEILVLDEPTAGIDVKTQHEVLHILAELNRDGVTVIMTTHDLNAVAAHLPWIICFNNGLIAQGRPVEVFTKEILKKTYGADMVILRHGDHILMSQDTPVSFGDKE